MGRRALITFPAQKISEIRMDITTHMPGLREQPLPIELLLNGERLCAFSLWRCGWLELSVPVPDALSGGNENGTFELEFRAERTWQPRPTEDETRDDRELSIAVCNIEVKSEG
jgi:hypothetical protein